MWPFKRKKKVANQQGTGLKCTFCGSSHAILQNYHGGDAPNPVRTWRGQRYLTCRCLDCDREFYIDEPQGGLPSNIATDEDMIDEEALKRAEDDLKRQIKNDNDRTYK
jgi:hypothetical protein